MRGAPAKKQDILDPRPPHLCSSSPRESPSHAPRHGRAIPYNVQRLPARRHRLPAGPHAEPRTAAKVRSRAPCPRSAPATAVRVPVEGRWGAEAATALFYGVGPREVSEADASDARQPAYLRDAASASEPQVFENPQGRGVAETPLFPADASRSAASTRSTSPPRLRLSALLAQGVANPA